MTAAAACWPNLNPPVICPAEMQHDPLKATWQHCCIHATASHELTGVEPHLFASSMQQMLVFCSCHCITPFEWQQHSACWHHLCGRCCWSSCLRHDIAPQCTALVEYWPICTCLHPLWVSRAMFANLAVLASFQDCCTPSGWHGSILPIWQCLPAS